jgi:copper chaperone
MNSRTFQVPDISCGHCKSAIEGRLAGEPGVISAEVTVEDRQVHVAGDADDASVIAAIEDAGYEGATRV